MGSESIINQKSSTMKNFLFSMFFICSTFAFGQNLGAIGDNGKILVDNNKVEVVKFVGKPQGNVCGIGMHHHKAHLTVALTDAKLLISSPDGKQQEVEIPAETALWFDAGSHSAINSGDEETKFLLVYLK